MKFYLAHNYDAREALARDVVPLFEAAGHSITSRWITEREEGRSDDDQRLYAERDLEDIRLADALVHFSDQVGPTPGRGKYIELGYAIGIGKPVIAIGPANLTVFYFLTEVRRVKSVKAFLG